LALYNKSNIINVDQDREEKMKSKAGYASFTSASDSDDADGSTLAADDYT